MAILQVEETCSVDLQKALPRSPRDRGMAFGLLCLGAVVRGAVLSESAVQMCDQLSLTTRKGRRGELGDPDSSETLWYQNGYDECSRVFKSTS